MAAWLRGKRLPRWLAVALGAVLVVVLLMATTRPAARETGQPAVDAVAEEDVYAVLAQAAPVTAPGAPEVGSPSAVLIDAASGQILFAKNPHERRAPASVTKIMTMDMIMDAVTQGRASLKDRVAVSERAFDQDPESTTMFLEAGETVPLEDILWGIAVASANDGSVAAAEHLGGSLERFVEMMNETARRLGMKDTHWSNPSGLPGKGPHYASAYDLALLSRHLVNRHPELLKYTATWEYWLTKGGKRFWLTNFNRGLVEYPGMDGLKTGFTGEAGYCLAATAKRGDRRLVAVVLGAASTKERNEDVYNLMDWGFAAFDTLHLARSSEAVGKVRVLEGRTREVEAVPAEDVAITVVRGQDARPTRSVQFPESVVAPVVKGQMLGKIQVRQGGRLVREVPLLAARHVPKAPPWQLFAWYWRAFWQPRAF